jgi:hypothetical protein
MGSTSWEGQQIQFSNFFGLSMLVIIMQNSFSIKLLWLLVMVQQMHLTQVSLELKLGQDAISAC